MSASSSNLASPKYGYNLVCATTQDAINVTMKRFLSHYDGTEFTACYTFDLTSLTAIETPLAQIQKVTGVDPFSIPDGSTDSSPPSGRCGTRSSSTRSAPSWACRAGWRRPPCRTW